MLEIPGLTTVLSPIIVCCMAAPDPSVVMCTRTASKHLTSGIGLLNSFIVFPAHNGSLVLPVKMAVAELKSATWGHDFRDIFRVAVSI